MYIRVPARYSLGEAVGPFEGTFNGEMTGDGTKTTITAVLTHKDNKVEGHIQLGPGLILDFSGACAPEPVDSTVFAVKGESLPGNPSKAVVSGQVQEPTKQFGKTSIGIAISITGELLDSGKTLKTNVTMKPDTMFCSKKTYPVQLTRK